MVKSVDPDATTAVIKNENGPENVVKSVTRKLHEPSVEGNMADNMEEGHPQNHTGKKTKSTSGCLQGRSLWQNTQMP